MFSVDEIVKKISEKAKISREEAAKLIKEKQKELSGLGSDEGAAYIVAREKGINLLKESKKQLRIGNLVDGLRSVDIVGKVVRTTDIREFERSGEKGRVANLILGDETGLVRLSLWNDEVDFLEKMKIVEGDVLRVSRGYVKMDNQGNLELRIGRGSIAKVKEDVKLPDVKEIRQDFTVARRKPIRDFREGGFEETRAAVVQLFRKNPFFEVCPKCGTRINSDDSNNWVCGEHGRVEPDYGMVISGVIDDGTGNIRAVFFRELAEKLMGKTTSELRNEHKDPIEIFDGFENLGRDFIIRGRVKLNALTENRELVVNDIADVDIKKEAAELLKSIPGQ
jgi:replication factor A1